MIRCAAATLLAAVAALPSTGCTRGEHVVQGDLLVSAGRVFDGERVIEDGAVLIAFGRVAWVGRLGEADVQATRRASFPSGTILPGFIDLHVHRLGPDVATGVTTSRDLGAPIGQLTLAVPDPPPGEKRLLLAGPMITVPGGYPIPVWGAAIGEPVRGGAEARAAVRLLADHGAAVIKISLEHQFPMLSASEVTAIVDEAHALGLDVTAHVSHVDVARIALESGVDELAHMPCVGRDVEIMRELARDVPVVGTLHVALGCPALLENARAFVAAGGVLLYGSDYGSDREVPNGIDVEELELLVAAGLSPLEAIAAATSRAGEALGLAPLGSLVEAAPADLIVVRGDPTKRLEELARPLLVVAGGKVVAGSEHVRG